MLITTRETPAYSIHCGVNQGTTKAFTGDVNSTNMEHSVAYGATSRSYESESSFEADSSLKISGASGSEISQTTPFAMSAGDHHEDSSESLTIVPSHHHCLGSNQSSATSILPTAGSCFQREAQVPEASRPNLDVASSSAAATSARHDLLTLEQSLDIYKYNKQEQQPSSIPASSTRLVSSLKKKSSSGSSSSPTKSASHGTTAKQARPLTQRRVRGIWNDRAAAATHLDLLRNDTLSHILSFLPVTDLLRASMVAGRWRFLSSQDALWKGIDATEFIHQAHATFYQQDAQTATQKTCESLQAILKNRTLESLKIQDIGHKLSADVYLPFLTSLKELTLTGFTDLTDTHLHVMLLMVGGVTRAAAPTSLRKLVLQDCPQLSNSTIRSIATRCTHLEEISLKGNPLMNDLEPLANLLVTIPKPAGCTPPVPLHGRGPATMAALSLQSFFAPPPKAVPPLPPPPPPTEPTTPPRPASPPTHPLQSLFAPPGMSPPRKTVLRPSILVSAGGSASNVAQPRKLQRLDIDLAASSLIKCLQVASINNTRMVQLQSISLNGDSVTDSFLKNLAHHLDLQELQELDVSTTTTENSSPKLTNRGLQMLVPLTNNCLSTLTKLNLSGHSRITGSGLASLLTAAPKLIELNMSGCKGLSSDPDGMVQLCKSLSSSSLPNALQLETLHLQGCFSTKAQAQSNVRQFAKEVKLWLMLRDALCEHQTQRLQTLNLNDCFGVRPGDITLLRQSCPQLIQFQYQATCAWDKQQQQQAAAGK